MHIDLSGQQQMRAALGGKTTRRPWARLLDALLSLAGGHAELISHAETPWASATFSGSRHRVCLSFNGNDAVAAAEHFIEAIPDHEFTLPGQLVADAAVIEASLVMQPVPVFAVEIELLLLADA